MRRVSRPWSRQRLRGKADTSTSRVFSEPTRATAHLQDFLRADARTRAGDPFITRQRRVRNGRPGKATRGHAIAGKRLILSSRARTCEPAPAVPHVPVLYPAVEAVSTNARKQKPAPAASIRSSWRPDDVLVEFPDGRRFAFELAQATGSRSSSKPKPTTGVVRFLSIRRGVASCRRKVGHSLRHADLPCPRTQLATTPTSSSIRNRTSSRVMSRCSNTGGRRSSPLVWRRSWDRLAALLEVVLAMSPPASHPSPRSQPDPIGSRCCRKETKWW